MNDNIKELIAEARAAGEHRTPGPWATSLDSTTRNQNYVIDASGEGVWSDEGYCSKPDAAFIAHAGTHADTILNALEAARARVKELEKERDYCRPEVQGFARLMEAALRAKDCERGGNSWQHQTMVWEISPHLQQQVALVRSHIGDATRASDEFDADMSLDSAAIHAVHAANFAMMIVDLCGTLPRAALNSEGG